MGGSVNHTVETRKKHLDRLEAYARFHRPSDRNSLLNLVRKNQADDAETELILTSLAHMDGYPIPTNDRTRIPTLKKGNTSERMGTIAQCQLLGRSRPTRVDHFILLHCACTIEAEAAWSQQELEKSADVRREIRAQVMGIQFTGLLSDVKTFHARIDCIYFRESVHVHRDDLLSGDLVQGAAVSFDVTVPQGESRFRAVNVRSEGTIRPFLGTSCLRRELETDSWKRALRAAYENGDPAVVFFGGPKHLDPEALVGTLGCTHSEIRPLDDCSVPYGAYPAIAEIALVACRDFDSVGPAHIRRAAGRGYMEHVRQREMSTPGWVVLMDESGPMNDDKGRMSSAAPSVLIAVAVPPTTKLPSCPPSFHSTESAGSEVRRLRQTIIDHPEVRVFAWSYRSGKPASRLGKTMLTRSLHEQMWKHATTVILEDIANTASASRNPDAPPVRVSFYVERTDDKQIVTTNLLDFHVTGLLEANEARPGWERLLVNSPVFVGKDEHPLLGYPDAMGEVFRGPMDEADASLWATLHGRPNTHRLDYDQRTLELIHGALLQAGGTPEAAVASLMKMQSHAIEGHNWLLGPLVQSCLSRLEARDIHSLFAAVEHALVQEPDRYVAAELICDSMPIDDTLLDALGKHTLAIVLLGKLLAHNHRADVEAAQKIANRLEPLIEDINAPQYWYRFRPRLADLNCNALDLDEAVRICSDGLEEADEDLGRVDAALHQCGFAAQLMAQKGDLDEARKRFEHLMKFQQTPTDRERIAVYLGHVHYDRNHPKDTWSAIEMAVVYGLSPDTETACYRSPYLLALVLKAQARWPNLTSEAIEALTKHTLTSFHPAYPWTTAAFWAIRCLGERSAVARSLLRSLHTSLDAPCESPVIRLIHRCLDDQLRVEGLLPERDGESPHEIPGMRTEDAPTSRPPRFRQDPELKDGMLLPLRFYFR